MLTYGKAASACNCLHGTAAIDENGDCHCVDSPPINGWLPTAGVPTPPLQKTVYIYPAAGKVPIPAAANVDHDEEFTIFGFNPLLVLGVVAAGWYFMSSSEKDGKTK